MRSLGNTYLIEIPQMKQEVLDGGIILPAENKFKCGHYRGIVKEIGLNAHNSDINIGDIVYFDYTTKEGKVKVGFGTKLYYIVEEQYIFAKEIQE